MCKTIQEVYEQIAESRGKIVETNGFKPVIVKTKYDKKNYSYGIQFWSDFLINQKWSKNSDGTVAEFVELV